MRGRIPSQYDLDALEDDGARAGQICEELAREQLWLRAPRAADASAAAELTYSFRHALFRQVVYERIAATARPWLHRKVAAALKRGRSAGVPVAAAELARHFERGREPLAALRYYAQAAEAALLRLSSVPVHDPHPTRFDSARSGAGGGRAQGA